jgi:hypothetical protein
VIALVGKIQRCLEPRQQIEQRRIDRSDAPRQRPFELVERRTRLERRRRVNQIANGLRLDQVEPPIQIRTKGELSGLGEPRPRTHRRVNNRAQHDRTPVRADFDHILSGVRVWRDERGREDFINTADACERRVPRRERRLAIEDRPRDVLAGGAADSHDPESPPAWRRRDRDDRVFD